MKQWGTVTTRARPPVKMYYCSNLIATFIKNTVTVQICHFAFSCAVQKLGEQDVLSPLFNIRYNIWLGRKFHLVIEWGGGGVGGGSFPPVLYISEEHPWCSWVSLTWGMFNHTMVSETKKIYLKNPQEFWLVTPLLTISINIVVFFTTHKGSMSHEDLFWK